MERWLPCKGLPNYEISDEARVRNVKTGRVMKTNMNKKGYETVTLREGGSSHTRKVASLVADAFIDSEHDGLDLTYRDGDRSNNRPDNLEYCTRKEVARRAFESGSRNADHRSRRVRDITTGEIYKSIAECSRVTGINSSSISRSVNGSHIDIYGGHRFEAVD